MAKGKRRRDRAPAAGDRQAHPDRTRRPAPERGRGGDPLPDGRGSDAPDRGAVQSSGRGDVPAGLPGPRGPAPCRLHAPGSPAGRRADHMTKTEIAEVQRVIDEWVETMVPAN